MVGLNHFSLMIPSSFRLELEVMCLGLVLSAHGHFEQTDLIEWSNTACPWQRVMIRAEIHRKLQCFELVRFHVVKGY